MNATPVPERSPTPPEGNAVRLASAITRGWVALYTRGVSPEAAHRRRTEIDSDLWEQRTEALTAGTQRVRLAVEVTSRLLRGMPADIAWRSHMEGSFMSISIPANRWVGLLFLFTIVLTVVSTLPGYDTRPELWESQMRDISNTSSTTTNLTHGFQALAGIALIAAAGLFTHLLRGHNPLLASISGYGLAATGILTVGTSAMYTVMIELSRQWAENPAANAAIGDTARAFGLGATHFNMAGALVLVLSVGSMAVVTVRAKLVPAWASLLPAIGVPAFISSAFISFAVIGDSGDGFVWITAMVGLMCSAAWLIVAGIALVSRRDVHPAVAPITV